MPTYDKERQILEKLNSGLEFAGKKWEYIRNASPEELIGRLQKYGIDITEERILADYAKYKEVFKVMDAYYVQYKENFDRIPEEELLDSDALEPLVEKVVKDRFDPVITGDPYFIDNILEDLLETDPKKVRQEDVENLIRAMISYSSRSGCRKLSNIGDCYDYNPPLAELVSLCQERTPQFRALIREFYECYEDASAKILPSVYRIWKESQDIAKKS